MTRKYIHRPDWKSQKTDIKVLRAREYARRRGQRERLKVEDPEEYERRRIAERVRVNATRRKQPRKDKDRGTVHGRLRFLLKGARKRALAKGLEWDIRIADVWMPTHCPVLGIPLSTEPGGSRMNRYSLDRSDSRKGYVKGNVQVISYRANMLKNNATAAELFAVFQYVAALEELEEILA